MVVAPLGPASTLPPVSAVAPITRVVRRARSGKTSRTSGAAEGDAGVVAAMRTPEEASSTATQEALMKLELGG